MITTIRQSTLGMWARCGEQLRRYMVDGPVPPGIAARRGSAGHKAAQINHEQKKKTRKDLPLSDLQDAARDEFVRLVQDEGVFIPRKRMSEKNGILNDALNQAIEATRIYHDNIAPKIMPVSAEETLTVDVPGIPLPISGTLDTRDESAFIQDFKIMKRKGQEWGDVDWQPSFYYLLVYYSHGFWPKGFKYQSVIPNKTMAYAEITTTRTIHQIRPLFYVIEQFLRELREGIFKPADPHHWICSPNWCGYYGNCRFVSK